MSGRSSSVPCYRGPKQGPMHAEMHRAPKSAEGSAMCSVDVSIKSPACAAPAPTETSARSEVAKRPERGREAAGARSRSGRSEGAERPERGSGAAGARERSFKSEIPKKFLGILGTGVRETNTR